MISRQAHTITVLVMFSCILVYVTLFEEETYGADYNNKRYILWFFVAYEENLGEFQVEYKIWFLVCTDLEPRFQIQGHGHKKSRTKYLWSKVIWICINGYTMCSDLEWISDSKLMVTGNLVQCIIVLFLNLLAHTWRTLVMIAWYIIYILLSEMQEYKNQVHVVLSRT